MRIRPLAALIPLSLALAAAPAFAEQDIEKMNGSVTAEADGEYGSLSTLNGGITIREGATVREAETVNGGITVKAKARVGAAETVNGGIRLEDGASAGEIDVVNGGVRLGRDVRIEGDVEAVNGGVRVEAGTEIGGNVENVNGAMYFDRARVGGEVVTTHGDITLEGSTVRGDLRVEKPSSSWWSSKRKRMPRIIIGAGSVVGGEMVFEHEVELYVHPDAKVGKQSGVSPKMIDGPDAPRAD
ncbi:hypothetical protein GCM10011521_16540 [Arenimonas soli]|uniref:Polymer-forming cytoskeletal protein n=1 Tax=Arenimonas soli TaxID=2269504 RepID=A0ABQ1HK32_9GAMM|nr:hypothetical protein [Arenimonas soli]GGA79021.1 hypothetical protein GCM10011521_16540 [Arenimonas soli]